MCSDGWSYRGETPLDEISECTLCGADVDKDGDALEGCHFARETCPQCGDAPCDDGC